MMRKELSIMNPHWRKSTIARFSDRQVIAIYYKQISKARLIKVEKLTYLKEE